MIGVKSISGVQENIQISNVNGLQTQLNNKQTKVEGKVLSTNDYTTQQKTKLSNIESNAEVNIIQTINVDSTQLTVTDKTVNIDLSGKVDKRQTVTDASSTTKTISSVAANTDYHLGTLTSLTLTEVAVSDYETNIFFTSGATITVNLPATLKIIGQATFEASKEYVISILNNIAVVGTIGE